MSSVAATSLSITPSAKILKTGESSQSASSEHPGSLRASFVICLGIIYYKTKCFSPSNKWSFDTKKMYFLFSSLNTFSNSNTYDYYNLLLLVSRHGHQVVSCTAEKKRWREQWRGFQESTTCRRTAMSDWAPGSRHVSASRSMHCSFRKMKGMPEFAFCHLFKHSSHLQQLCFLLQQRQCKNRSSHCNCHFLELDYGLDPNVPFHSHSRHMNPIHHDVWQRELRQRTAKKATETSAVYKKGRVREHRVIKAGWTRNKL